MNRRTAVLAARLFVGIEGAGRRGGRSRRRITRTANAQVDSSFLASEFMGQRLDAAEKALFNELQDKAIRGVECKAFFVCLAVQGFDPSVELLYGQFFLETCKALWPEVE